MSDQTLSDDLAQAGAVIDQNQTDAARAAMSAAASEFASQVNADAAQAAAQVAQAAALDNGTLSSILAELGALRGDIAMLVAAGGAVAAQEEPEPEIVIQVQEEPETPADGDQEEPGEESDGVTVEDAGGVPEGRQKSKRGLMGRKRK